MKAFLGAILLPSINIRIRVHLLPFHWEAKYHGQRVNLWEALCASEDLHVTYGILFSSENENNEPQS